MNDKGRKSHKDNSNRDKEKRERRNQGGEGINEEAGREKRDR